MELAREFWYGTEGVMGVLTAWDRRDTMCACVLNTYTRKASSLSTLLLDQATVVNSLSRTISIASRHSSASFSRRSLAGSRTARGMSRTLPSPISWGFWGHRTLRQFYLIQVASATMRIGLDGFSRLSSEVLGHGFQTNFPDSGYREPLPTPDSDL